MKTKKTKQQRKDEVLEEYSKKRRLIEEEYEKKEGPLFEEYSKKIKEINAEPDEPKKVCSKCGQEIKK